MLSLLALGTVTAAAPKQDSSVLLLNTPWSICRDRIGATAAGTGRARAGAREAGLGRSGLGMMIIPNQGGGGGEKEGLGMMIIPNQVTVLEAYYGVVRYVTEYPMLHMRHH